MAERNRLRRAGDRGWLLESDERAVTGIALAVREQDWAGLVAEVVPAARTVLITAKKAAHTEQIGSLLQKMLTEHGEDDEPASSGRTVEIPVRYDGPDLGAVADALDMSTAEVVAAHTCAAHVVEFFGFAPGFAYIDGLPETLSLPRRPSPRTRIEAGSVAIAGNHTVVYPGTTPGGWHLIGRTEERLWDPHGAPPNRLSIGDRVVFKAVHPC
ncbi:5-oxoprolinase subunit B family protein [Sciscionella sediminilitoris]|uniref:5-oxoprolinase subunit B family protein n=1 Tax=Sciscionella sediminilitoris TaxID=1445613 RepID=UPI0004DFC63E|nr:allophanate hydrolase subunit 1 [Sciscionella sp. SE31]